jgi:hypothetical protein
VGGASGSDTDGRDGVAAAAPAVDGQAHADTLAALPPEWASPYRWLESALAALREAYGISVVVYNAPPPPWR